jgi:HlyD family secretion protein
MKRFTKQTLVSAVLVGFVASAAFLYQQRGNRSSTSFRTVAVKRGDLVATITATGTVEPEEVVDVGAQVAGQIVAFGKDKNGKTIDYGSVVENGTVLAQIDDTLYAANVAEVRAQLQQAKAGVQRAEADLVQLQAKLVQAEQDWKRARELGPSDALSQSDYDALRSGYEIAKANVAVGKAAIVQTRYAVSQAEATLRREEQNLNYCTIRSPVKGVIIDRRVNIGQTVVASLNAPSLFLIAKDLKRLQVWVSVNEADIGNIRPGQPVIFTVDAYPGQVFKGEVGKVRLNASMTQNVVTYTVEVNTDNSDGRLLPYLTANVQFLVSQRHNVLLVPSSALRWTPQPDQQAPENSDQMGTGSSGGQKGRVASTAKAGEEDQTRGVVWVPTGVQVRAVRVHIGASNGGLTEVQGDGLEEGVLVVVGKQEKDKEGTASSSPFTPQLFRRNSQGQRQ